MGLAIIVGMLADLRAEDPEGADWFLADMEKVNAVLAGNGLPFHVESEAPLPEASRCSIVGFPYSYSTTCVEFMPMWLVIQTGNFKSFPGMRTLLTTPFCRIARTKKVTCYGIRMQKDSIFR